MCKHPALTYLNQYGYNIAKLLRAGIQFLDVLGRDYPLEKHGTISEVWTSKKPVASTPSLGSTLNRSRRIVEPSAKRRAS
jgi:hypothetical protein